MRRPLLLHKAGDLEIKKRNGKIVLHFRCAIATATASRAVLTLLLFSLPLNESIILLLAQLPCSYSDACLRDTTKTITPCDFRTIESFQ